MHSQKLFLESSMKYHYTDPQETSLGQNTGGIILETSKHVT